MKIKLIFLILACVLPIDLLAMHGCFYRCCVDPSDSEKLINYEQSPFFCFYIMTPNDGYISYAEAHEILTKINKLCTISKSALVAFARFCGTYTSFFDWQDRANYAILFRHGFIDSSGKITDPKIATIVNAAVKDFPNCFVPVLTERQLYKYFENKQCLIKDDMILGKAKK